MGNVDLELVDMVFFEWSLADACSVGPWVGRRRKSSSWCSWYRGTLASLTDCQWWVNSPLVVLVVQLVSRHSCVADRLPVVVRFPAGP